jgi:hypothetical protein
MRGTRSEYTSTICGLSGWRSCRLRVDCSELSYCGTPASPIHRNTSRLRSRLHLRSCLRAVTPKPHALPLRGVCANWNDCWGPSNGPIVARDTVVGKPRRDTSRVHRSACRSAVRDTHGVLGQRYGCRGNWIRLLPLHPLGNVGRAIKGVHRSTSEYAVGPHCWNYG